MKNSLFCLRATPVAAPIIEAGSTSRQDANALGLEQLLHLSLLHSCRAVARRGAADVHRHSIEEKLQKGLLHDPDRVAFFDVALRAVMEQEETQQAWQIHNMAVVLTVSENALMFKQ